MPEHVCETQRSYAGRFYPLPEQPGAAYGSLTDPRDLDSGGTINLQVGQLSGTGQIRADGRTKNGADNVGGGGGRVAVSYSSLFTLPLANVSARGGDGYYADGQDGTVFTQQIP